MRPRYLCLARTDLADLSLRTWSVVQPEDNDDGDNDDNDKDDEGGNDSNGGNGNNDLEDNHTRPTSSSPAAAHWLHRSNDDGRA